MPSMQTITFCEGDTCSEESIIGWCAGGLESHFRWMGWPENVKDQLWEAVGEQQGNSEGGKHFMQKHPNVLGPEGGWCGGSS